MKTKKGCDERRLKSGREMGGVGGDRSGPSSNVRFSPEIKEVFFAFY